MCKFYVIVGNFVCHIMFVWVQKKNLQPLWCTEDILKKYIPSWTVNVFKEYIFLYELCILIISFYKYVTTYQKTAYQILC